MATSDLKAARKSLNAGRIDEALLHLWNGLEAARLAGGSERRQFRQLAAAVRAHGDEYERREAERLLAELEPTDDGSPSWTVEDDAEAWAFEDEGETEAPERAEGPPGASPSAPEEPAAAARTAGWGRFLLPIVIGLFVLLNLIARLVSGE